MRIPKLLKSERTREFSNYSEDIIDKVIYGYLFQGKSNRKLDEEYININADYSRGWQSMGILHYFGIRNDFKSLFIEVSVENAIKHLKDLGDSEYDPIIKSLERHILCNEEQIENNERTHWMISANSKIYRHSESFQARGFIDWRQRSNFQRYDIVYIYCTKPLKKVMFKTRVEDINMTFDEIIDDKEFWISIEEYEKSKSGRYCRLKLLEQVDSEKLSLENLLLHGLKMAPQGSVKLNENLIQYLDKSFNVYHASEYFPEEIENKNIAEGVSKTITVNKYERSSKARNKCVEHRGCFCHICGMDFMKTYGEIGRDFIHVHHIVPLSKINKSYEVDYIKDLIPVCPNCHSMLHRKIDGREVTVEQLKRMLEYHKRIGSIQLSKSD